MVNEWTHGGKRLRFQDGDYVRIDLSQMKDRYALDFTEGYVRGYDISEADGITSVAYELFKVGHNPLRWVRGEFLSLAPAPFAEPHGKGHGSAPCHLCGANL